MRNVLLAYNKGKTVLGMFERFMGPDRFRDGVRAYMREHAWKNTVSAQFWAALDRAAGSEASKALATFIEQPGLPLVRVERIAPNQVRLEQRRFGVAGSALPPQAWRIPVGLRWSDGRQACVETVLLDGPARSVTLPAPDVAWVFPNADSAGYYRWDVPDAELRDLAAHAGQRLSTAERIGFLGNLAALLDAGEVGGREYLGVIERFGQDPELEVVTAALGALAKLEPPFVSEANREALASYVRRVFGPALDRIGLEPRAGEPAAVTGARPALLTWLGDRGRDPRVLAWAQTTAERLRRDPASVPASVAATALRLAASTGDAALFDEYRARFEGAQVPADRGLYLNAIAGFRDSNVRDRILAWAPTAGLRLNELVLVSNAFRATPAERDHVFEWMTASYDALSAAIPPGFRPGLANLAGGCEPERVARADAFFRDKDVAGVDKELAKVREQVGECVALRSREAEAIGAYLSGGRAAQP
jgi:alanyl aminopeptidase